MSKIGEEQTLDQLRMLSMASSYDLGENLRTVLMSATEGEDKSLKYLTIFNTSDIVIITKTDLAQAVDFDWDAARRDIHAVAPA